MRKFNEYKNLDLIAISDSVAKFWKDNDTFKKSVETREGHPEFVFYEGPPSANGMPGIHHVMARSLKDIFCRFQTQNGKQVFRKAGWDTHGLPVELGVEKELGITKEDIGRKNNDRRIQPSVSQCRDALYRCLERPYRKNRLLGRFGRPIYHLPTEIYGNRLVAFETTLQQRFAL
ncbi:hypothetical protein BPO_1890 [Bergeyella porcorum]|uniref:Aminoacyl-tRNA synthetase class Ia domain-containing protein n=1 Tax=Bergeyella porcorum TaxID=1735111 RepID=A0AAU0F590_9FLAO